MTFRSIVFIIFALTLAGCASRPTLFKMSDPSTTKVVEGNLVRVDVRRVPTAVTTTEAALTGVAANHVGDKAIGGAVLVLGVIDDLTTPKYQNDAHIVILDQNTQQEETVVIKNAVGRIKGHKPGDHIRAIYQGDSVYLVNLTVSPDMDSKTK